MPLFKFLSSLFPRGLAGYSLQYSIGLIYLALHLTLTWGGIPVASARPLLAQVEDSPLDSEPSNSESVDLSPEIIEGSPVLQRWLEEVPNVLEEIRNDPSFRTRVRVGYAQVTSSDDDGSGVNVGVEDLFIGDTGLTLSGDYFAGSGGYSGGGAQLRYYVLPLGGYFNLAPVVGYRQIEGESYSTSGVELGGRAMLVLSRTGGADLSLGYSVVGVGGDQTVGLGTLAVGYAITPQFRLSTDIRRHDAEGDNDTRFGIAIEWMPRL
ncbi:hypothetical protein [Laspinema olomoucense]|uniref:Transporter n=1 Tax=Laspinema olomoucense D3b TaxID=2953688 RepID=A0ABT2N931_9CYAN|nr:MULTISPECIES: hypothetical protein [unclassified Laspinema]MCT7975799.1 hypothetical protein [Laspinema sp. D3d]MCT7979192.1 hypothetical protein [Laspinema sp. D3b]MCT7991312.1 hypothetical protein [Laspinema sp. D3a]